MQALISPNEKVYAENGAVLGDRVADTAPVAFEVAPPLFWVTCADDVKADKWYYANGTLMPVPLAPVEG